MTFRAAQTNFSKGEIAPHLYGRFDVDAWQAGLKRARNVVVMKYGGVTKRPGTRLVAPVIDGSEDTLLFPFTFSLEQTYILEFGQGYMSPVALGGRVVEEELEITDITAAAEGVVEAAFHSYAVGNTVYLSGIDGAMGALLNGRYWTVTDAPDDDHFAINADTTGLTFTGATGGITRSGAVVDPTPPPVPPPVAPPDPPDVYAGWGDGWRDWPYYYY